VIPNILPMRNETRAFKLKLTAENLESYLFGFRLIISQP
jgi:hypothetical protein